MAIPPVATGATDVELGEYSRRLFEAVKIPIIVQDASGYVGVPMSIDFQAGLLDSFGPDRAWFKPEAVPIGPRLSQLRDTTDSRARIFEGTGGISLVDSFQRGISGTIPGADLIRGIVPLWQALENGNLTRATQIHGPLSSLISIQTSLDGFLAVEKHLLVRRGIFQNEIVRGPRGFVLDDETRNEVDRLFDLMMEAIAFETI
jgi:4-hydroxy-tetrahydrodipicolinate synthase